MMPSETQFDEWRSGLPLEQQALLERLTWTNRELAYSLYPVSEGPPETTICVHEAGHAAAMHAMGIPIAFAMAKDSHGAVQPAKRPEGIQIDPVAYGMVMLAGDMAANHPPLTNAEWMATIQGRRSNVQSDERQAVLFARALDNPGDDEATFAKIVRFWNLNIDMFAAPGFWPAIQAVASILRRDGRIEGTIVHELCEQCIPYGSLAHLTKEST